MSEDDLEKHKNELNTINNLKSRQFYLTKLNKVTHQLNGVSDDLINQPALAHDYLESDFRDKLLDMEDQIYNGSLGSIKVRLLFTFVLKLN